MPSHRVRLSGCPLRSGFAVAGADGQEAQHHLHHGRRHRVVQHRRVSPGDHGRADAEPRPARVRGHAVHRLLRRGELHGGAGQLHHRRDPDPDRDDDGRPGRRDDRHAGRGADDRDGAEGDGLRDGTVRQEPPGRPEPVPADGPRLRRVLRLPVPPGRDGRPVSRQLPSGGEGHGGPAQHASYLGHGRGRPDGAAPLGQGRKAEDRGRRHIVSGPHGNHRRRDPVERPQVRRQVEGRRQAVLPLAEPDPDARRHASVAQVREAADAGERLVVAGGRHGAARRHRRRPS